MGRWFLLCEMKGQHKTSPMWGRELKIGSDKQKTSVRYNIIAQLSYQESKNI